ncbi:MAG: hypothetical protein IK099_00065 [Clostridia bacterium]|nr:hypothetical protein [Clostridia bacterium]
MLKDIPEFSCGDETLERAFRLALGAFAINTKRVSSGLLAKPRPCLMAGLDYPSPWTRDAAINVYFAAALLAPDLARNTLLSVLETRGGEPVIGGQYWDRLIWLLGAERLWKTAGDTCFARLAFDAGRRTMDICLREEYDPSDGLFRGPAVYGDGVSAYPLRYRNPSLSSSILRWSAEHPASRTPVGGGIPMKALSTNCMYEYAFRVLARLADALGEDSAGFSRQAEELKDAVNRSFWNPDTGMYDYLAMECEAQESLGLAFAVLFGIAGQDRARSVFEHAHITDHGVPCVWPPFPPYDASGYGRHCGTVWPHIQGFWALAALKAGRGDLFSRELSALAGHAVRDGQFAEIYHPEDGRIYGGIQEGGGKYVEWRSCAWQTWSAAALLGMVFYGVFGLDEEGRPGQAFLPPNAAYAEMSGLTVGGRELRLAAGQRRG